MSEYEKIIKKAKEYSSKDDLENAIPKYLKAIEIDPDQVSAFYELALLYHQQGNIPESLKYFEQAIKLTPCDASIHNNLGVLYYKQDDFEKAEKSFKKALEIEPNYIDALYALAKLYQNQSKMYDAASLLKRCLNIRPDWKKVQLLLDSCCQQPNTQVTKDQYQRILIVMDQGIGNMVMLTPTLRAIREVLPNCELAVLGCQPSVQVLDGWEVVTKVITEPDDESYDICFYTIWSGTYAKIYGQDLHRKCKHNHFIRMDNPDLHETLHHLKIAQFLGYSGELPQPYCAIDTTHVEFPKDKKIIALSDTTLAGGAWERKRWPHYQELAHILTEHGYVIVLIGGKAEAEQFNPNDWPKDIINCLGKYSIPQTAYILKHCDAFIGNDSGPAHVAAAVNIPTYVIFGATKVSKNKPLGPNVKVISKDLPCSPCQYTWRWNSCSTWKCINDIHVDDVLRDLQKSIAIPVLNSRSYAPAKSSGACMSIPSPRVQSEQCDLDVGEKPKDIQIQTVSRCNGTCAFCPYPQVSKSISHGQIAETLFKKIVNQCSDLDHVSLYLMNEPLLDKKLAEKVRYVKEHTGAIVNISTNGSLLTKNRVDELVDAGMDLFMISLTAGNYDEDTIFHLKDRGVDVELVYILTKDTAPHLDEFRKKFEGFKMIGGAANNRGGNVNNFDVQDITGFDPKAVENAGLCGKLTRMLYVLYNGDCVLCCNDYRREVIVGNFRDHTIEEIWNSKMLQMYRRLQAQRLRKILPLCSTCNYGVQSVPIQSSKKLVAMLRVKNAIDTIGECLDSLSRFVDEIVIVDNGSTDGTLEVYKKYPAIVDIKRTEGFDEGRDKNLVLDMAKKRNPDWIIWIDSDEVFENRMTRELVQKWLNQDKYTSIWFKQYHFWRDRQHYRIDQRWKPNYQRAMWQNQPNTFFSRDKIHNSLIQGLTGQPFYSDIRLKHYGHISEEATRKRYHLYRQIDNPKSAHWTGRTYNHMIDESMVELAEWHDEISEEKVVTTKTNEIEGILQSGFQLFQYGKFADAEKLLEASLKIAPENALVLNNLGIMQYKQGKLENARENFEKALSFDFKYKDAAVNLRKVRLEIIQKRIERAIAEYSLDKFPIIENYVKRIKTELAASNLVTIPVAQRLKERRFWAHNGQDKQTVIFLSVNPRVDMIKKADALKNTGKYRVVLLCAQQTAGVLDGFFREFFDEVITYNNWLELVYFLLTLKPDIYIARPKNNIAVLAIVYGNAPVIFNVYDSEIINTSDDLLDPQNPESLSFREKVEAEHFCFENAAGIIHKGSVDEIEKFIRPKCHITAPVLHFYPFCWDRYFAPMDTPKLSQQDGEIHLVYTGMVAPSNTDKRLMGHSQFAPMIKTITAQQIHWSIYYNPETGINDKYYQEYFDLEKNNRRFHFRSPLPYDRLCEEIAQYDFGFMVHDVRGTIWDQKCGNVSTANKIFTYLEAGLPMIVGDTFDAVAEFVKEYSVGLVVDPTNLSDLADMIRAVDYRQLKTNVLKARQLLSLEQNISKLINLIDDAIVYHKNKVLESV